MTLEQIIKETENLSLSEQKKLATYFFVKFIDSKNVDSVINQSIRHKSKCELQFSGAEPLGKIDMENLRKDLYSHL